MVLSAVPRAPAGELKVLLCGWIHEGLECGVIYLSPCMPARGGQQRIYTRPNILFRGPSAQRPSLESFRNPLSIVQPPTSELLAEDDDHIRLVPERLAT